MRLPANSALSIPGMSLPTGHVFACLAETLLMGFEDESEHGSYGALSLEKIRALLAAADKHGFELGPSGYVERPDGLGTDSFAA